jgi:hypothetical protein
MVDDVKKLVVYNLCLIALVVGPRLTSRYKVLCGESGAAERR